MTSYAGEEYKIVTVPTEYGSTNVLSDDEVGGVRITIVDAALVEAVSDASMTFDQTAQEWYYMWNTDGLPFGTYKAKITVLGLDGGDNWEIKRIRLSRNPF